MTKEEAVVKMREIADSNIYDEEGSHIQADKLMCDILDRIGYEEVSLMFRAMDKWYSHRRMEG